MSSTVDQCNALEREIESILSDSFGTAVPVKVWGDNSDELKDAAVAVFVHAEKETEPACGRQVCKLAVAVRCAATEDRDRTILDAKCAAAEAALKSADPDVGTGCALVIQGWGPVTYTADSFLARQLDLRAFITFS